MVKEFGNSTMILVRVALVDMRLQVPQMLQIEVLEMIVMMIVMMRRIPRRILKKSQMGLKPNSRV